LSSIDYTLRPAKNIERKMILEGLQRLSAYCHVPTFRYIGFGALYFRDFILFHKALGMRDMVSIEKDTAQKHRYLANRPFDCIDLQFGSASERLPNIDLGSKSNIVWLDYTELLSKDIMSDISLVCRNVCYPSVLIVTVNADYAKVEPPDDDTSIDEMEGDWSSGESGLPPKSSKRFTLLKARLGNHIPPETVSGNLKEWGTAALFAQIINSQISQEVRSRKTTGAQLEQGEYLEMFRFLYSDGARMLTTGGILYPSVCKKQLDLCKLEELEFCKYANFPYIIPSPKLTARERARLDEKLPGNPETSISDVGIPENLVDSYRKIYRYFPHFSEVDV